MSLARPRTQSPLSCQTLSAPSFALQQHVCRPFDFSCLASSCHCPFSSCHFLLFSCLCYSACLFSCPLCPSCSVLFYLLYPSFYFLCPSCSAPFYLPSPSSCPPCPFSYLPFPSSYRLCPSSYLPSFSSYRPSSWPFPSFSFSPKRSPHAELDARLGRLLMPLPCSPA